MRKPSVVGVISMRSDDQELLLEPFDGCQDLHPDFQRRLGVLLRQCLDTLARVGGDHRPVGDRLDGEPVVQTGRKAEQISRQVDVDELPAPVRAHQVLASRT